MNADSLLHSIQTTVKLAAANSNSTSSDYNTFSGTLSATYIIAIVILSFIAVSLSAVLFSVYFSVRTKKQQYALLARNNPDKPITRPSPASARAPAGRSPAAPRPYAGTPGQYYAPRPAAGGHGQQMRAPVPAAYSHQQQLRAPAPAAYGGAAGPNYRR